jgi:hypothetical protein
MPTTYELLYGSEHLQWCSVCDPAKIFLTSKFSYLLFCNHTHKTKAGTSNQWETTNSKQPRPIIMIGQSKRGSSSRIRFITLFSGKCPTFYQPQQTVQKCWAKTILLSQSDMSDVSGSHSEHRWGCFQARRKVGQDNSLARTVDLYVPLT